MGYLFVFPRHEEKNIAVKTALMLLTDYCIIIIWIIAISASMVINMTTTISVINFVDLE